MKKGRKSAARGLIRKIRKPIAPPLRVAEDKKRYSRARERERVRRAEEPGDKDEGEQPVSS